MAIRKYASLEQAQVLGVKGTQDRARTASLDKFADFADFRTSDGYLYARIRAISSRVNKNHDGWPSIELAGSEELFKRHASSVDIGGFTVESSEGNEYGFATFVGKPIFVDHHNSDPERARGVIVDAKLHVEDFRTAAELDPYYASAPDNHTPPTWVELLLEVDAKTFPKLAKAIIEGSKDSKKGIDGFSMGCDVEKSVCAICKNAATSPDEYCKHVKLKGAEFDWVNPKTGRKESKKSYEDCHGIKFFEISAVFDPADETALTREIIHEGEKTAMVKEAPGKKHVPGASPKENRQYEHIKKQYLDEGKSEEEAAELAARTVNKQKSSSVRTAENPVPQADMMTAPEHVDTMRENEVCPVCGSDMDEGHQCEVCGYVAPPDGLDNPDLSQAQNTNELQDPESLGNPANNPDIQVPSEVDTPPAGPPSNLPSTSSVTNDMTWQVHHPKLAGQINPVEKPLQSNPRPATDEPQENILSDQDKPVTNRTAASMIAAVNQGDKMSDTKTAADAPTADTRADKRVDVTGVGGVMDPSAEAASKADAQVDVEGTGGVIEDSNAEASAPDHKENLPTAGEGSDDAGFNKDKTTQDSGQTKTFDNSNEPGSAVTQKSFPTAGVEAAKQGVKPNGGPDVQPSKRVDVESDEGWNNPGTDTDQWTGTDGNGVTKQQPPVTDKVYAPFTASVVQILKIADAEVDLGLTSVEEKYDRIAELEAASPEALEATAKVLARVKTAGLKKSAATKQGGVGRVPSLARAASVESSVPTEADEQMFW